MLSEIIVLSQPYPHLVCIDKLNIIQFKLYKPKTFITTTFIHKYVVGDKTHYSCRRINIHADTLVIIYMSCFIADSW